MLLFLSVISQRLQNIFSLVNMTFPEEPQIKRIFLSLLNQKLSVFDPEVKVIGKCWQFDFLHGVDSVFLPSAITLITAEPVTMATIDLYNAVAAKMLPTPSKTHYLFNLRDISRVSQH